MLGVAHFHNFICKSIPANNIVQFYAHPECCLFRSQLYLKIECHGPNIFVQIRASNNDISFEPLKEFSFLAFYIRDDKVVGSVPDAYHVRSFCHAIRELKIFVKHCTGTRRCNHHHFVVRYLSGNETKDSSKVHTAM